MLERAKTTFQCLQMDWIGLSHLHLSSYKKCDVGFSLVVMMMMMISHEMV
jgi:hypothetical protein